MKGYLTLEFVVAIVLGSFLLSLATPSIISMAHTYTTLKAEQEEIATDLRFRELLKAVSTALDRHRFWLLPRSQKILTFSDGTLNPIMFADTASAPIENSNMLTSLTLDTTQVFAFKQITLQQTNALGEACSIVQKRVQSSDHAHFIALGATSFTELHGEATRESSFCFSFSLRRGKSMLPQARQSNEELRPYLLIPIESLYTLYVDKRRQLRFLGHRGERNIENQPILQGIEYANFIVTITPEALVHLEGKLRLPSSRELNYATTNRLSRVPAMNFVLNSR